MVSENLARRFKPAGFEQPEGHRRNYIKPRAELQEAFDEWLGGLCEILSEEEYGKACKLVKSLGEISYREANSLLFDFEPKTYIEKEAGLFISACYTHSFEEAIVFDLDAPEISCIGYRTNKNIFNNGKVGAFFASFSSGLSINNGECEGWFAYSSLGLSINNGECGDWFARWSSGLSVTVKEPKGYVWKEKGRTIKPEDCERIPELKKYIDELAEITRNIKDEESAKTFLERYGPEPRERIELDIKKMLRKGGIEV